MMSGYRVYLKKTQIISYNQKTLKDVYLVDSSQIRILLNRLKNFQVTCLFITQKMEDAVVYIHASACVQKGFIQSLRSGPHKFL